MSGSQTSGKCDAGAGGAESEEEVCACAFVRVFGYAFCLSPSEVPPPLPSSLCAVIVTPTLRASARRDPIVPLLSCVRVQETCTNTARWNVVLGAEKVSLDGQTRGEQTSWMHQPSWGITSCGHLRGASPWIHAWRRTNGDTTVAHCHIQAMDD